MPLPKTWTTVTPLSKTIAMILFIFLPFIGFSAGMRYQQKIDEIQKYEETITPTPTVLPIPTDTSLKTYPTQGPIRQKVCTQDAMQCSNGVWVGRTGPNCEFICPR